MRSLEQVADRIVTLRGERVMLDADLAKLYGVPTKRLKEQVRRNAERFPQDFLFHLTGQEVARLRSQIATSNEGRGGARYAPFAFAEHGAIMAANVLNSVRAIEMSVYVVRAFIQLRRAALASKETGARLDEPERKVGTHDRAVARILETLRRLTEPPAEPQRRRIGFVRDDQKRNTDKVLDL
jgi:hypothetical protein